MPRYADMPEEMTPFAKLLINYMWNERPPNRPPLSPHQLAIRIGASQQNLSNWIARASLPSFETMMEVLDRLDIPMSALYEAYKSAGIPMPRWDSNQPRKTPSSSARPPALRTSRKPVTVPSDLTLDKASDAPEPLPYTPPPPAPSQAEEWDRIVADTEKTLRQEGVSESAIAAVIADLRSRQSGEATPIQRNVIAEHTETTQTSDHEPTHDDPATSLPSGQPARSGRATKESAGD